MFSLLEKIFIKNRKNTTSEKKQINSETRQLYGIVSGALGIFLNIMLFAGKLIAGLIAKSVAITADAFNNLSDAGSSLITILGFKLAAKKPDAEHPFGHGRIEYVSGLIVAMLIILMGFELAHTSIDSIIHPKPVESSLLVIVILCIAILVKFYMYFYNHMVAKKINSAAIEATAKDSLGDTLSTLLVLASIAESNFTPFPFDGWAGLIVAIIILKAGFDAAKDTIEPLLGEAPKKEFVKKIEQNVIKYKYVVGVHDIIVHDYGPGRLMISLHAEVPGDHDIFILHDMIDNIEKDLEHEFKCSAVIHLDPVETNNAKLNALRAVIAEEVKKIDKSITIHDFRMVPGTTHTNIIFDAIKPRTLKMSTEEFQKTIVNCIHSSHPKYYPVVTIDQEYV
ncbi:MAG: cation-efflux pump [Treponema sp. CETP13]|nr:MAG: cation-efflux pump [Treponema sp. CETP13]